jgi:AraC-like DNA-binding protein
MAYGTEVAISGVEDQDFVLLMLPLSGTADIGLNRQAVQCDPGKAVVTSTVELDRMRWSQNCSQLVVQISTAAIDRHMTMLTGRSLRDPVRFTPEMIVTADRPSWWSYVTLLLDELSSSDGRGAQASIAHLETLLIVKLLETQCSNYRDQLQPQSCRIAPQHVRRVEHFIADEVDRPITLEELVEVSGVSARALFDGFRRFRGQSPMAYLRSVRFERVRHDLLNARAGETVTSIACRWGFYQFGRFAGQYRQIFGELPSETLRAHS